MNLHNPAENFPSHLQDLMGGLTDVMLSGVKKEYVRKQPAYKKPGYYFLSGIILFDIPNDAGAKLNMGVVTDRALPWRHETDNIATVSLYDRVVDEGMDFTNPGYGRFLGTALRVQANGVVEVGSWQEDRLPDPELNPEGHVAYMRLLGRLGMDGIIPGLLQPTGESIKIEPNVEQVNRLTSFIGDTILPAVSAPRESYRIRVDY